MFDELTLIQEQFQPHLLNRDYTFIGPQNETLLEPFMANVNNFAPGNFFDNSWHRVLSNRQAVRQAINVFPPNTPLKIYVVIRGGDDTYLIHSTIEEYCRDNNIQFQ